MAETFGAIAKGMYGGTFGPIKDGFARFNDPSVGKAEAAAHLAVAIFDAGLQLPSVTTGLLLPVLIGIPRGFEKDTTVGEAVARQLEPKMIHEVRQNEGAATYLKGAEYAILGFIATKAAPWAFWAIADRVGDFITAVQAIGK